MRTKDKDIVWSIHRKGLEEGEPDAVKMQEVLDFYYPRNPVKQRDLLMAYVEIGGLHPDGKVSHEEILAVAGKHDVIEVFNREMAQAYTNWLRNLAPS